MVFKTVASSAKTIVDLTDAYTVSLSNESVSIACDVAGTAVAGELGAGGKATAVLSVYKGTIALTAVGSGVTPAVGQYKYIIGTTTGSTVARSNDSTFYIATLLADAGSVPVTIYLEGNTTTVTKTLTWNKSKTGATGKAIVSIAEEYYYSTSSSTQSDSSWGTAVPAWVNGRYLWTRTRTVFSSGPDSLTNPVCITGQKGTDGTIYYTWVKYADNADGTIGMADTPAGKRYIGISVNQTSSTESTTPTFYTWSPLYDNVVVGGTNLWLDSSPEKSLANWNVGDGTKTLDATMLWQGKPTIKFVKASVTAGGLSNNNVRSGLPASTQFAYSFMVRSSVSMPLNANSMGHMQVLGTSDGGANNHRETAITYSPTTIPANVWTKATIVFSTPAEAIAGETFTFRSFLYYLTYGATYYFSDFQLEKGNISSDWTPAPEDVSNQIETKAKTFTSTPVVPYNIGDIWKNGTSVYVCSTPRNTGSFLLSEWTLTADTTTAQRLNEDPAVTRVTGRKLHFTDQVLMDDAWIEKLVANSIIATKIQATELDAGKITTGSLNASLITTGSLNASLITTGALNASLITTGNFDASRITAGVISAGNGKSTINMSTGAFSLGSGKIAFDGTTLSLNVDSLKITNSSVATQTYTDTAVTNIEVGGRNTFKKTTSITQASGTNTRTANALNGTTIVSTVAGSVRINNVITENGNWTFSAWVTSTVAGTLTIDFADNSSQTFAISTTRTKISKTGLVANYSVGTYHFIDISGLPISTVTFEDVKVEKGNKATAWTPAPEDVAYDIEQKADSSATLDAINAVASSAANAQSIANSKLDTSSYDNFINEYLDYKKAIASEQSDSSKNLQDAKDAISSITNSMGDMKESWTFNNGTQIDATGSGMLLSDGTGGMNLLLSNNRISFFDSGVEVAYIADKTLKINHGIFVKSAQIGAHLISSSPSNPDITIVSWVGI